MDESVIGVKTGFTDEAGHCLVSAARRDGVTLICVTLDDPNDWQDHLTLYDTCFAQLESVEIDAQTWQMPVVGAQEQEISVGMDQGLTIGTTDGTAPELDYVLETMPFLYAPVETG